MSSVCASEHACFEVRSSSKCDVVSHSTRTVEMCHLPWELLNLLAAPWICEILLMVWDGKQCEVGRRH